MVKTYIELPERADGTIDLESWLSRLSPHFSQEALQRVREAALLSLEYGGLSVTPVNASCFRQGLYIVEVLLNLQPDVDTIIAAMVYFSACYGQLTLEQIEQTLGEKIKELVQGVLRLENTEVKTDLSDPKENLGGQSSRDNIRRMLLAIVEDVRVVLIKLAEQVVLLRTIPKTDTKMQKRHARLVRDIYAPLANRLGIGQIKWELEDLSFRYLEAKSYKEIAKLLDEKRINRDAYIKRVVELINASLAEHDIQAQVQGRAKHIYSIWRKMQRKGLEFSDIYDVRAIRILVNNLTECYTVLGLVHGLWQYIPKEFDDYIATPKENGYRSLHTAVVGPEGKTLEVQIRTHQMHKEAELGVAAHWVYKEGLSRDASYHSKLATLRQILDWQEEVEALEGAEQDKSAYAEIFDDRVYVFTPRGDVVDLIKGATPIDFAYHVHSEVGNRCRGAKVNGAMVPLNYELHSGDQIEILTAKNGHPSRDWLNPHLGYVKSSRARAKVHAWFRLQDREKNLQEGRELLDREVKRLGLDKPDLERLAPNFNLKKSEDVLAALGRGDVRLSQLLGQTEPKIEPAIEIKTASKPTKHDIQIEGVGDLLCTYAKCCKPVPGDAITGYITLGRGVTIHRKDCLNILSESQNNTPRLIQVSWGRNTQNVYPVDVGIMAYDRQGLLSDITSVLAKSQVNVTGVSTQTNADNTAHLQLTLQIDSLNTLGNILSKILQLPNVLEAYRIREGQKRN